MLKSLLHRLTSHAAEPLHEMDAQIAFAALLVRLARSDAHYATEEEARIDIILGGLYKLSPFEAAALRAKAEQLETDAPDTVRFTRAIKAVIPPEGRATFMSALWSVVLSDGERRDEEEGFLRMVANLLGVSDVDSAIARQRALQQKV